MLTEKVRKVVCLLGLLGCVLAFPVVGAPEVTITWAAPNWGSDILNFYNLRSMFEKETGIKVNMVLLGELELYQKQLLDLSTGAGSYDVISNNHTEIYKFAKAGWIEPLNKYISDPKLGADIHFEDFIGAYMGALTYSGKVYALPFVAGTPMLIFRKDLFDKYSLKVPDTIPEFYEVGKKIMELEPGIYGAVLRSKRSFALNTYIWSQFLKAYGGEFFDKAWNPIFNGDEGVKSLEIYTKINKELGPEGAATNYAWDDIEHMIQQGKLAMTIETDHMSYRVEDPKLSTVVGKLGFAPIPGMPGPKGPLGQAGGRWPFPSVWAHFVNAGSKHKEAAFQFVKWLTSPEIQRIANKPSATRYSLYSDEFFKNRVNEWGGDLFMKAQQENLKYAMEILKLPKEYNRDTNFYFPWMAEAVECGDRIGIAMEEYASDTKTAKQALDDAATDVREILKKAGYYK